MARKLRVVNIHAAKTHLSRLVEEATQGSPFIIAKAGKPMVKVMAVDSADSGSRRLGFLSGEITTPHDFDSMGADAILQIFGQSA